YDRRGIWLSFSAKQRLERDAPIFTAKIRFEPAEPLDALVDRIRAALGEGRSGRETAVEREVNTFLRLPAPALRLGVRVVRRLDAWGVLPARFVDPDPLYASAFVANLGSVGLEAAYHHLFEYGTIPIFVTLGRVHRAPVVLADGSVGSRETFTMRYTYDERVEDGFYAARAPERLQACLEEPAHLAGCAAPRAGRGGETGGGGRASTRSTGRWSALSPARTTASSAARPAGGAASRTRRAAATTTWWPAARAR